MKAIFSILLLFIANTVVAQLPAPLNLITEYDSASRVIVLHWDSINENNSGYHLFVKEPDQSKYYLSGKAGPISKTSYTYQIFATQAGNFSFKVAAFRNYPEVVYGTQSEPQTVEVPSADLPMVADVTIKVKKQSTELSWTFNYQVFDLRGFLIKLNQTEFLIDPEKRTYRFNDLKSGVYSVSITAVSSSGVNGESSSKSLFRIK